MLGVNQLAQLALKAAPVMDSRGWAAVVATLEAACTLDPLQQVRMFSVLQCMCGGTMK